jgi:uncharacterized protein
MEQRCRDSRGPAMAARDGRMAGGDTPVRDSHPTAATAHDPYGGGVNENDWRANLITGGGDAQQLLLEARRIAVIGIKTQEQAFQPAYYVPEYLQGAGFDIVPVPVYYPDTAEILGQPVHRSLAAVSGRIDMVVLFRRPADVPKHLDEILECRPDSVWMQLGIRNDAAAEQLARAGIRVVQDRCTMIDHRRR